VLRAYGFRQVQREAYYLLWGRPAPPLARMQYQVDVLPDPRSRLDRLRAGYPLLQRAMVEQPVEGCRPRRRRRGCRSPGGTRRGSRWRWTPPPTGCWCWPTPWSPRWRVTVDGKPAELLRVDHNLRGVRVPAGAHQVVFTYHDRAMRLGAALAAATCLGLATVWALRRGRARRAAAPAP
jgi:Bacterial membrane protein YfhO